MRKLIFTIATFGCVCFFSFMPQCLAAAPATNGLTTPAGAMPLQITNRKDLKIVVQINNPATMPNGISKQLFALKNLHDQYAALGMKSGVDYEVAVVFRAEGSQFLLNDAAYDFEGQRATPWRQPE